MDSVTYSIVQHYDKFQIVMKDTHFCRPWYLKNVRKGTYDWTQSSLFGKDFSLRTAEKHLANLEAGADKDWSWYQNSWENYWKEIAGKKGEQV